MLERPETPPPNEAVLRLSEHDKVAMEQQFNSEKLEPLLAVIGKSSPKHDVKPSIDMFDNAVNEDEVKELSKENSDNQPKSPVFAKPESPMKSPSPSSHHSKPESPRKSPSPIKGDEPPPKMPHLPEIDDDVVAKMPKEEFKDEAMED